MHTLLEDDAVRTSPKQPTDFKSTNVKLTVKNSSQTTMTIANRRCSFMNIFSLSPRHGHSNFSSSNKRITFSNFYPLLIPYLCQLMLGACGKDFSSFCKPCAQHDTLSISLKSSLFKTSTHHHQHSSTNSIIIYPLLRAPFAFDIYSNTLLSLSYNLIYHSWSMLQFFALTTINLKSEF